MPELWNEVSGGDQEGSGRGSMMMVGCYHIVIWSRNKEQVCRKSVELMNHSREKGQSSGRCKKIPP